MPKLKQTPDDDYEADSVIVEKDVSIRIPAWLRDAIHKCDILSGTFAQKLTGLLKYYSSNKPCMGDLVVSEEEGPIDTTDGITSIL